MASCLAVHNKVPQVRSSSFSVPAVVKATQRALIRLERWSEYWCLPPNPSKCEAFLFSVDPHQANLQPHLLNNSHLRFNPTQTFFKVTFYRTLSFSKHVSSLKAKLFSRVKALRCISAFSLLYKAFLRPLLTFSFYCYQHYQLGRPILSG